MLVWIWILVAIHVSYCCSIFVSGNSLDQFMNFVLFIFWRMTWLLLILVKIYISLHDVLSPSSLRKTKLPVVILAGKVMHLAGLALDFALGPWFFACGKVCWNCKTSSLIARAFPDIWSHWNMISLEERSLEHIWEFNDSKTKSKTLWLSLWNWTLDEGALAQVFGCSYWLQHSCSRVWGTHNDL